VLPQPRAGLDPWLGQALLKLFHLSGQHLSFRVIVCRIDGVTFIVNQAFKLTLGQALFGFLLRGFGFLLAASQFIIERGLWFFGHGILLQSGVLKHEMTKWFAGYMGAIAFISRGKCEEMALKCIISYCI